MSKKEIRSQQIIDAAMKLSEKKGYQNVMRSEIASEAGCATGLVSHYYGTMSQLKRAVMRHAVETENLTVIAQGLAERDKHALKADEEVKKAAVATLIQ
jgi:AcrR family transcriptional regulator